MFTEEAGFLQRFAHLLGDGHEEVVEHFQHHRVGIGADGKIARLGLNALQHEMIARGQLRLPARLDDHRLVVFDKDGRAGYGLAAGDIAAPDDGASCHAPSVKMRVLSPRGPRLDSFLRRLIAPGHRASAP
jgi:hypothetical protein